MLRKKLIKALRVPPGTRLDLAKRDPDRAPIPELEVVKGEEPEDAAKGFLKDNLSELSDAQERLWANDVYSVLMVLQAMDTAGKDGIIKHVMSGINPQGCQVVSFKRPSDEELDHDFLWRCARALPERGRIGIFNRSYYEEVLVVRVHPEILTRQKLPPGERDRGFWEDRYASINGFERHLTRNGTIVLKFFLHISKEEQRQRLLARLDHEEKHWKFELADLDERKLWDQYTKAYEDALSATSTKWAPWYVVPANNKWAARALVAAVLTSAIERLDLQYPEVSAEDLKKFAAAKRELEAEQKKRKRKKE